MDEGCPAMQVWRLNDTEEWIPVVRRKDDESVSISEDCGDELRTRLGKKSPSS